MNTFFKTYTQKSLELLEFSKSKFDNNHPFLVAYENFLLDSSLSHKVLKKYAIPSAITYTVTIVFSYIFTKNIENLFYIAIFFMISQLTMFFILDSKLNSKNGLHGIRSRKKIIERNLLDELQANPNFLKTLWKEYPFLKEDELTILAKHIAINSSENIIESLITILTSIKNHYDSLKLTPEQQIEANIKNLIYSEEQETSSYNIKNSKEKIINSL